MTLTDEQCAVLEKIASKSKMDCWFYIDGDNQIRDLEEGERVINTMEGIRLLQEGMSCYADYDLTYREIYIFEHIPGLVVQPEHWEGLEKPMDYFDAEKLYSVKVRSILKDTYGIDNLDFEEGDALRVDIILDIAFFLSSGKSEQESIEAALLEHKDEIQYIRMASHGYVIAHSTDAQSGNIPNAEFVSLYRGLVGTECADEDLAVQLAKADGVKFIEGMNGVPDNYYIDTPQNRNAILKHLQADNH